MKKISSNCLLITLLPLFILFGGCESKSHSDNPEKSWFYEDEFAQDTTLHANIENVVILDISSSEDLDSSEDHAVQYVYKEDGEHVFCIDSNEKHITEMALLDENGNVELALKKEDGCANVYLYAGQYIMQIRHDASKVPESGTVAFVHHPSNTLYDQNETNLTSDTNPPYYTFQVSGGEYDGYYLSAEEMDIKYYYKDPMGLPYVYPATRDFLTVVPPLESSNFKEKRVFFIFPKNEFGDKVIEGYNWKSYGVMETADTYLGICYPSTPPLMWTDDNEMFFCVDSQDESKLQEFPTMVFMSYLEHWPRSDPSNPDPESIPFNIQWDLLLKQDDPSEQIYTIWNDPAAFLLESSSLYAAENRVMYRTASSKGPINQTNFIINKSIPLYKDGSQYTLQPNEVAISESCDLKGPTYVIDSDISAIPKAISLAMPKIKSIKFGSDETNIILFGEKDFEDWKKTVGMDVECTDEPIGFETIGSMKILNAKKVFISSHQCDYCDLAGVDFSDLTLDNMSLRYANLTNVSFHNSVLEKSDMRYAKLYGANLNYADLNGSTMCGAFLNGNSLSQNNAATLTGAYLKNVNLSKSNLNGTNFDYANFHSLTSGGCIPTDCGFTAQCSSAAYATLDSSSFTNAYLSGTDFSHSNIVVSDFTNAILTGANFSHSSIYGDTDKGASTKFVGAFIQGANFSDAETSSVDFTSAYVDLIGNNGLFFILGSEHTEFASWTPSGEKVCTLYAYTSPTIPPSSMDITCRCPSGDAGPCSDWDDPQIDMNMSTQEASYITDPNPVCSDPNFNW